MCSHQTFGFSYFQDKNIWYAISINLHDKFYNLYAFGPTDIVKKLREEAGIMCRKIFNYRP